VGLQSAQLKVVLSGAAAEAPGGRHSNSGDLEPLLSGKLSPSGDITRLNPGVAGGVPIAATEVVQGRAEQGQREQCRPNVRFDEGSYGYPTILARRGHQTGAYTCPRFDDRRQRHQSICLGASAPHTDGPRQRQTGWWAGRPRVGTALLARSPPPRGLRAS
jgi:hypothetical protein